MPERIQRKRTKGWRKPPGSIMCTRPSRWSNPYPVEMFGLDMALALFENTVHGVWNPGTLGQDKSDEMFDAAYEAHTNWLRRLGGHPLELVEYELGGADLGCYCGPDKRCHVDILLPLANKHDYVAATEKAS